MQTGVDTILHWVIVLQKKLVLFARRIKKFYYCFGAKLPDFSEALR